MRKNGSLLRGPRSLRSQVLAAIAIALIIAQGVNLILLHQGQIARQQNMVANSAAFRLLAPERGRIGAEAGRVAEQGARPKGVRRGGRRASFDTFGGVRTFRPMISDTSPLRPGERRQSAIEAQVEEIMLRQGVIPEQIIAVRRRYENEPQSRRRMLRRAARSGLDERAIPRQFFVVAVQEEAEGQWRSVDVSGPRVGAFRGIGALFIQTVLLFLILFGALALILGRITRPLAALTKRSEEFAVYRDTSNQLDPSGPKDVSQLISAHNSLETKIAALLDEKDVMLGAIGHDLKTPLAALRVRIESVSNDTERAKMAESIDGIAASLDDILSLARVGRPTDPLEAVQLGSLVESIAEEYEDLGDPVSIEQTERIVSQMRASWIRRALRNLISNALRYGKNARVSLLRRDDMALLIVEDDGPGITDSDIDKMMEPFVRGEPSRNRLTGGAGLGLTLARAIAQQHGGSLTLTNRKDTDGKVTGLTAEIALPIS